MTNRFPLIVDSSGLQIKEIPANDNLDLANNNIVNVVDISASGIVTATSFSGSGIGLTNLSSAQLTGALPAIDGSALTGVISGIGIKTEGGNVGFGVTILDFRGSGISTITAPVSGISTINIIGSSGNIAGIDTLGISYFNNLNVSGVTTFAGVIEASAGENKIPSLYSNLAALPSASTYHGMFAHVHSTGRAYFAHAGNWLELVNKNVAGNVGTGTEGYNVGIITATGIDLNGDLDVDGHTNLDNVSVAGVTTIGAGTSTIGVEVPTVTLSNNNPTVAGTAGTTGEIKQIGGAPFYYDGSAWREFVLSEGTPVTAPADTDWDKVLIRNDFDSGNSDQKFSSAPVVTGTAFRVASPVKVGTKSLRLSNGHWAYLYRSEYGDVYSGEWTVEGWFYIDTLPTGVTGGSSALFSQSPYSTTGTTFMWGLVVEKNNNTYRFRWYNNNSSSYSYGTTGGDLGQVSVNDINRNWFHVALVREALNGSIHLYVNGVEQTETSSNQIIDNDLRTGSSYAFYLGYIKYNSISVANFDGFVDDFRLSKVARYTSNFTAPTTALPISGTSGTTYTPPGSMQGEIALGASPSWTGTTGATASQVASGQYRLTFSSPFSSSTAYTVNANVMDYDPATSIVGVGVSRVSSSVCDFYVRKVSDNSAVDTGSLAVNVYKK